VTFTPRTADLRLVRRRAAFALAHREVRRVLSLWTQTIAPPVITGVLFLIIFGGALGSHLRVVAGTPYPRFILPGLLVMTVTTQAFANTSTSVFQAKNEGYIDDVLTSPMRGGEIALAYPTGGLVRGWLAALIVQLLATPFTGLPTHPMLLATALILTGVIFASLGLITGIWADTFDHHAFVANLVITPLALLGGVFYTADRLSQPWSTLTRVDPLYYLVDAARTASIGHASPSSLAILVALGAAAGCNLISARLVTAGWRVKP